MMKYVFIILDILSLKAKRVEKVSGHVARWKKEKVSLAQKTSINM
jgi:hypothetical protein